MSKNYPFGRATPSGGAVGDVLVKQSTVDGDAAWGPTLSTKAANIPAVAGNVTLPDLATSYNALLVALKAAGVMVDD